MTNPDWPTLTLEVSGSQIGLPYITFGFTEPNGAASGAPTFDSQQFAPDALFTDITEQFRGCTIQRGRSRAMDHFNPATMTVEIDCGNPQLDAFNDYTVTSIAAHAPNTQIRLRATYKGISYWLFNGYIDSAVANYTPGTGSYHSLTWTCTDAFKPLQRFQPAAAGAPVGGGEDTGARVNRILNSASWSSTAREIQTGNSNLQAVAIGSTTALDDIYAAVDSERGQFYIAPDGNPRFENRWYRLSNSSSIHPQFVWSDDEVDATGGATNLGVTNSDVFTSAEEVWDDTLVANNVTGQIVGSSNPQLVFDVNSESENFNLSLNNTSLQLQTDADALNWAKWVLFQERNTTIRIDQLTCEPLGNPTVLFPEVLGRQISDMVAVLPGGQMVNQTNGYYVEGVTHHITTGDGGAANWVTTFLLSPSQISMSTPLSGFLIFDDPVFGQLDNNAFAQF